MQLLASQLAPDLIWKMTYLQL